MTKKNPLNPPQSLGRQLNFTAASSSTLCNTLLAEHDLTLAQWVVLGALWQRDELSVSEVSEYTGNAGPATSRIIDRMVDKGLVGRRTDPADRRAAKVFLDEKGEELRYLESFYQQVNKVLLKGLSEAESKMLYDLLDRVNLNARRGGGVVGE